VLISSKHNPTLKRLLELRQSKGRREQGLFLLDGQREIDRALATNRKIRAVYFCEKFPVDAVVLEKLRERTVPFIDVAPEAFECLAYRENPYGIVAEVESWGTALADLKLSQKPSLVLVAEFLEKPGNLGTLLRTADAAGADAVISCEAIGDLFNPNALRASQGAAFSVPYATGNREEVISWLRAQSLQIVATSPQATSSAWDLDYRQPTAFAMGSESRGLTDEFMTAADATVRLPMKGLGDSLNVAVSCGIVLYEALRQRGIK
jgi:TrmH family RNA methyltransferase